MKKVNEMKVEEIKGFELDFGGKKVCFSKEEVKNVFFYDPHGDAMRLKTLLNGVKFFYSANNPKLEFWGFRGTLEEITMDENGIVHGKIVPFYESGSETMKQILDLESGVITEEEIIEKRRKKEEEEKRKREEEKRKNPIMLENRRGEGIGYNSNWIQYKND